MTRALCLFIVTLHSFAVRGFSQSDTSRTGLDWSLEAAHLYQHTFDNYQIFEPGKGFIWSPGIATDNPIIHGASYAKLLARLEPIEGLWLKGEMVAEHRGISYGVYPKSAIEVFPRITLGFDTSFRIGGERIRLGFRLGHFNDLRLQEGLTIFNMDVQGSDAFVAYKRLSIRMHHIGDLEYSYGLGINDLHNYLIELDRVPLYGSASISTSVMFETGSANPIAYDGLKPNVWTAAASIRHDSLTVYSTIGRRGDMRHFQDNWATLFGVRGANYGEDIVLDGHLEYRFYTGGFNSKRYLGIRPYRTLMNGGFIYPLDRFERPFVAWAYYTEFQSSDVESVSGLLRGRIRLTNDFWLHAFGEAIAARTEFYGSQLLPFYDIGLAWQPLESSFVKVSMGNRAMNLDKHYPTLYALRIPAINIHFKLTY